MPSATITVEISPGELIDKITILEIKAERILDAAKLSNVESELGVLKAAREASIEASRELDDLTAGLKSVNERLWEIEDQIRDCERAKDFGTRFIALARSVYITNDERSTIKRQINETLDSSIVEEKSYAPY
ncbi:MAG: hypothetical protein HQL37_03405 [Alphaproteobacteria bacterium]|nr:hypothetical protein [Alphaproteobacteria bacterium]